MVMEGCSGYTDLNTQKLSENLLISNVLQPKNKPIPLKIGGTVQNPSITLDYSRLTNGMNSRTAFGYSNRYSRC
jgi:hypothetical protein